MVTEVQWQQQAQAFIARHWPSSAGAQHPAAMHLASTRWFEALAEQGLVRAPLAVICRRIELDQAAALPVANAVSAGANAADRYLGHVHNCASIDEPRQRTATLDIAGGDCGFSIALVSGVAGTS